MISEKNFIKKYQLFWKTLFPMSKHFLTRVKLYCDKNNTEFNFKTHNLRWSFVSEIAFMIFVDQTKNLSLKMNKNLYEEYKLGSISYGNIENKCKNKFILFDNVNRMPKSLDEDEYNDAIKLAMLMNNHFDSKNELTTMPYFKGCGFIDECFGDVIMGETLYEIKSVSGNFIMEHFKQVFVYFALNYISKNYSLKNIAIYNPRKDLCFKIPVQEFAVIIAGKSYVDLISDFERFVTTEYSSK